MENCVLRADDVERVSTYEEFFTLDMCIKLFLFHGFGPMVCSVACTELADRSKQILQP